MSGSIKLSDLLRLCLPPPPRLVGAYCPPPPPDARTKFVHNDLLCTGGGDRITNGKDPSYLRAFRLTRL